MQFVGTSPSPLPAPMAIQGRVWEGWGCESNQANDWHTGQPKVDLIRTIRYQTWKDLEDYLIYPLISIDQEIGPERDHVPDSSRVETRTQILYIKEHCYFVRQGSLNLCKAAPLNEDPKCCLFSSSSTTAATLRTSQGTEGPGLLFLAGTLRGLGCTECFPGFKSDERAERGPAIPSGRWEAAIDSLGFWISLSSLSHGLEQGPQVV